MSSSRPNSPRTTAGNVIFFKSPIWDHFKLCEDRKMAECQKCGEHVTRCGQSAKRPRLDNLRKHLLNIHDIDIPTVEDTKNKSTSKAKNPQKNVNFPKNKVCPSKKTKQSLEKDLPPTEKDVDDSLLDPVMCIKWNTYLSNMTSTLPSLLHSEQFVDVTLACEGQSLKCHRILLASCSPYFYELLTSSVCAHPIIMFKDFHFWELQALVSFMYSGEVNVRHSQLPRLLRVADALQIKGLAKPVSKESPQSEVEDQPVEKPIIQESREIIPQTKTEESVKKTKTEESVKSTLTKKKMKKSTVKASNVKRKRLSPNRTPLETPELLKGLVKRKTPHLPNIKQGVSAPKRVSPRKISGRRDNEEAKNQPLTDSHDLPEFLGSDMPDMLNDILAMKDVTEGISLPEAHRIGSVDGVFSLEDLETVKMDIDEVDQGISRMVANGLNLDQFDYFPINPELAVTEEEKR